MLTSDQDSALKEMVKLPPVFVLTGFAGTGKTFLLQHFIDQVNKDVIVTAPTHKAVRVAKGDSTIHSYLGLRLVNREDQKVLVSGSDDRAEYGQVVVVDEASMINTQVLRHLMDAKSRMNLKLVFVGDHCFAKGTDILMSDGTVKPIEKITIGEFVMGIDSQPRRVLRTCNGEAELYEVKQRNGLTYVVTPNHKIAFKRRRGNHSNRYPSYGDQPLVAAKDATALSNKFHEVFGGYNKCVDYSEQYVEVDPYYLGVWLGDGDSDSPRVSTPDNEVITFCSEYAEKLALHCHIKKFKGKNCYRVAITSGIGFQKGKGVNALLKKLKQCNLINNKHIPLDYLINTVDCRLSLLAGLIDSDGTYDAKGKRYSFTNKHRGLICDVKQLLAQLGFRYGESQDNNCIRLNIHGDIKRIPCKVARKIAKEPPKDDRSVTRVTVVQKGNGSFFGIEVSDDNLFLLPDGTVVSNCQIPPVKEKISPVWEIDAPGFALTKIVRQMEGNKIIQIASRARTTGVKRKDILEMADGKDILHGNLDQAKRFFADNVDGDVYPQILSHRNDVVDTLNNWARNHVKDNPKEPYLKGEQVYIRSTHGDAAYKLEEVVQILVVSEPYIFGMQFTEFAVTVVNLAVKSLMTGVEETITVPYREQDLNNFETNKYILASDAKVKKRNWGDYWAYVEALTSVKHIYAMTCHRSQGSTFKDTIVNFRDINCNRLLYTAITRASDRVFFIA